MITGLVSDFLVVEKTSGGLLDELKEFAGGATQQ